MNSDIFAAVNFNQWKQPECANPHKDWPMIAGISEIGFFQHMPQIAGFQYHCGLFHIRHAVCFVWRWNKGETNYWTDPHLSVSVSLSPSNSEVFFVSLHLVKLVAYPLEWLCGLPNSTDQGKQNNFVVNLTINGPTLPDRCISWSFPHSPITSGNVPAAEVIRGYLVRQDSVPLQLLMQ